MSSTSAAVTPLAQWFVHTCTTSGLSCHAETYSQQFIHFKTLLSMWHASFVTRCARPTSATTASIFLVEATDTPIDLIRREAIQRPADSIRMRRLTPDDSASAQMHQWELVSVAYAYGDATSLSASLTIRFYDPGPAGLGRLCPAVGAVESRTTQWEVPSVLGFRVESGLLLHFSVPEFLSQLVPLLRHTPVSLCFWLRWCRTVWRRAHACAGARSVPQGEHIVMRTEVLRGIERGSLS